MPSMPGRGHHALARLAVVAVVCWSSAALARPPGRISEVQRPSRAAIKANPRAAAIKRARAQGIRPEEVAASGEALDARAQAAGLSNPELRTELSTAPMRARLDVLVKAAARRGQTVRTFDRRLRGMLKNGKRNRVTSPMKRFFEVTPETFDLLPKVMGGNVVWFAASQYPDHLHTLLADQGRGRNFTHNT